MSTWRPALTIARREAWRSKARTTLVLAMIALPVLGVTAAVVLIKTTEVKGIERADRLLGAADARVVTEGRGQVIQLPDPGAHDWTYFGDVLVDEAPGVEELSDSLGAGRAMTPVTSGDGFFIVGQRRISVTTTEIDLTDPLARGLFKLTDGVMPSGPGEVVVNDALLAKGVTLGDRLDLADTEKDPVVVGSGRDATSRTVPVALGPVGSIVTAGVPERSWLVGGGEVTWAQVRALNQMGFIVTSRAVLADPPDVVSMAEAMGYETRRDETAAVVTLLVVMALLEVVLLAGPAFAVGARRQTRALALMSASGATPRQARIVVLASAVVLGLAASIAGVVLGVIVAWLSLPLVQGMNAFWLGPFEVPPPWLAVIAGLGLASALLAALVPAWIASRQDVVAVLAGRRGDRRPSLRSPVLGLVLLGVGIAGSTYGALTIANTSYGAIWIAACAVISVLGMILVVPVVVSGIARLSSRLPLSVRYAARDAARHRTRTVPAVAAVAATVAGVVALGIADSSDGALEAVTYTSTMPMGSARVEQHAEFGRIEQRSQGDTEEAARARWDRATQLTVSTLPDATVTPVRVVPATTPTGAEQQLELHADRGAERFSLEEGARRWGASSILVADELPVWARADLGERQSEAADAALAAGRVVAFTSLPVDASAVRLVHLRWGPNGESERERYGSFPASFFEVDDVAPAEAVLPTKLSDELGLHPAMAALMISGTDVTKAQETELKEALGGVMPEVDVYVERGYQRGSETKIILLVLFTLGGVLMLGGTLTATFLALSDARPDLATLSAVGASPRTRRRVAAAYALVIGFVGALLGAGVGFIPGIAISRPLTSYSNSGPYLDIPWLMIVGLVVVLPLVTAAVVGLTARSRLPLVARLG